MRLLSAIDKYYTNTQERKAIKALQKPNSTRLLAIVTCTPDTFDQRPTAEQSVLRYDASILMRHASNFQDQQAITKACILFPEQIHDPETNVTVPQIQQVLQALSRPDPMAHPTEQAQTSRATAIANCLRKISALGPREISMHERRHLTEEMIRGEVEAGRGDQLDGLLNHYAQFDPKLWLKAGNALYAFNPPQGLHYYRQSLCQPLERNNFACANLILTQAVANNQLSIIRELCQHMAARIPFITIARELDETSQTPETTQESQPHEKLRLILINTLYEAGLQIPTNAPPLLLRYRIEHGLPAQLPEGTQPLITLETLVLLADPVVPLDILSNSEVRAHIDRRSYLTMALSGYAHQDSMADRAPYLHLLATVNRQGGQYNPVIIRELIQSEEHQVAALFLPTDLIQCDLIELLLEIYHPTNAFRDLLVQAVTQSISQPNAHTASLCRLIDHLLENTALTPSFKPILKYRYQQEEDPTCWGKLLLLLARNRHFQDHLFHDANDASFFIKLIQRVRVAAAQPYLTDSLLMPPTHIGEGIHGIVAELANRARLHYVKGWINGWNETGCHFPPNWSQPWVTTGAELFREMDAFSWVVAVAYPNWEEGKALPSLVTTVMDQNPIVASDIFTAVGRLHLPNQESRNRYAEALIEYLLLDRPNGSFITQATAADSLECTAGLEPIMPGELYFKPSPRCIETYSEEYAAGAVSSLKKGYQCQSECACTVSSETALQLEVAPEAITTLRAAAVKQHFVHNDQWRSCQQESCIGGQEVDSSQAAVRQPSANEKPCSLCHFDPSRKVMADAESRIGNVKMLLDDLDAGKSRNGEGMVRECFHCGKMAMKDGACSSVNCRTEDHGCGKTSNFVGGDRPKEGFSPHYCFNNGMPAQEYIPSMNSLLWKEGFFSFAKGCVPKTNNPQLMAKLIKNKDQWFAEFKARVLAEAAAAENSMNAKKSRENQAWSPVDHLQLSEVIQPPLSQQNWWPQSLMHLPAVGDRIHYRLDHSWHTGVVRDLVEGVSLQVEDLHNRSTHQVPWGTSGVATANPALREQTPFWAPYGSVPTLDPTSLKVGDWVEFYNAPPSFTNLAKKVGNLMVVAGMVSRAYSDQPASGWQVGKLLQIEQIEGQLTLTIESTAQGETTTLAYSPSLVAAVGTHEPANKPPATHS